MAGTGGEREPCAPVNSHIPNTGAAKSGALDAAHQNLEAELNEMTSIWPLLSADLRKAVLTIIRAGRNGCGQETGGMFLATGRSKEFNQRAGRID